MNQSGSGAGHFSLMETSRRYVEKYISLGVDYRLQVENLDVWGLSHVLKTLDILFTSILSDVTTGMAATGKSIL